MSEDDLEFFLNETSKVLTVIRHTSTEDSIEISLEEKVISDEVFNHLLDIASGRGYTAFTAGVENAEIFFVRARKSHLSHLKPGYVSFLLTVGSIVFAGYSYVSSYYSQGSLAVDLGLATAYFTVPMLFFMGFREFGRFLASVHFGRKYDLPIMIPNPILLGFGGSISTQETPFRNGREMLVLGGIPIILGYVASFLLVSLGTVISIPYHASASVVTPEYLRIGNPFLFSPVLDTVVPANGVFSPIEFAGWAGVIISALNTLPIGNLDGGLIWRPIVGNKLRSYQLLVTIALVLVGLFLTFFIVIPVAVLVTGYQSPEPLNSRSILPAGARTIFVVIVLAAVLTLIPVQTHQYLDSMKVSAVSSSSISIMGIDSSSTFQIMVNNTGNHSFVPSFAVSPTVPFSVASAGAALSPGHFFVYNVTLFTGNLGIPGTHQYRITAYSGVVQSSVNVSIQYVRSSPNLSINNTFGEYSVYTQQGEKIPVVLANHGSTLQRASIYLFSTNQMSFSLTINTTIYENTTLAENGFLQLNQLTLDPGASIVLQFALYSSFQHVTLAFITPGYEAVILNVYHP